VTEDPRAPGHGDGRGSVVQASELLYAWVGERVRCLNCNRAAMNHRKEFQAGKL
jgi:hypothetical protein